MIFTLIGTFVGAEIGERFAKRNVQSQDSAAVCLEAGGLAGAAVGAITGVVLDCLIGYKYWFSK